MQMTVGEGAVPGVSGAADVSQRTLSVVEGPADSEYDRDPLYGPSAESAKTEQKQVIPRPVNKTAAPRDIEPEWAVFPESNYSFESDSTLGNKWGSGSPEERFKKRQEAYLREGTRRSVAAVFLVHCAEYPHVLLLLDQQQQKHSLIMFKYKTWQKPKEVLQQKLSKYLIKPEQNSKRKWVAQQLSTDGPDLEVGEFLGEWWRGEFDDDLVPYLPPHVTRPKERVRVHQVQLPHRCSFRIPVGFCLTVVPIFELSPQRVGLAIGGLSHLIARFSIRLMVPTLDKYEADTSLEHKGEAGLDDLGTSFDIHELEEQPDVAGGHSEAKPALENDGELEMLPPELQHLAELEEAE
ncbi:mRNA cleavage factor-like protein, putative [Eimeria tenella]|uniref:mRNA cleavage factor-like protein, putative n=1 Tax=Eimeria tenella TaxID=5802 RepID=U6L172_EIMTE|nr:mRNA cleavage factor-like protein, putative [Eimeria tenella]CDJ42354.1 mRNA cleavage factor-like protein, putative [Eimeria tenella]|eukprot:XP_013233104.1 mRNA cleavage factor-like protein, putative [Eimeria tenella]